MGRSKAKARPKEPDGRPRPVKKSTVKVEFRRDLGLLDITMIGIGAMIGAGIFLLSGIAAGYAGPATIIAFLLSGVMNLITGMMYAELSSAYPEAGGGYLWVRKGLPPPFGFVSGWISWFGHILSCSLYALGFGAYLAWLLDEFHVNPIPSSAFLGPDKVIAVIACLLLLYINYRGTSATGKSETYLTMSKIVLLLMFIAFGTIAMVNNPTALDNLMSDYFPGSGGILFAVSITLIAFQGYEVIAQKTEEVKEPKKNIPRAITISLVAVTAIYISIMVVMFGIITTDILQESGASSPSEFLESSGVSGELALIKVSFAAIGPVGLVVVLLGGYLSTLSGLNATIFSSSRVSFAMGRDRTLPAFLGKIHDQRRTPQNSIAVSGLIMIFMILFLPMLTVAGSAGMMFLVLFTITNAAGIALRYKMPKLDRGFKVPLFPGLTILGIFLNLLLIYPLYLVEPLSVYVGVIWIMIGTYVYFFTGAKKDILEEPFEVREMPASVPEEVARRYRVLVPVAFMEHGDMSDLGALLAKEKCGDLSLLSIVEVPGTTPVSSIPYSAVQGQIEKMEALEKRAKLFGVHVDARLLLSRQVAATIIEVSTTENADLVLLGWHGSSRKGTIMGTNIDSVATSVKADVAVFKWKGLKERPEHILVLGGQNEHADEAVRVAAIYAEHHRAEVTLMTLSLTGKLSEDEKARFFRQRRVLADRGLRVRIKVLEQASLLRTVMREAKDADILFMGAMDEPSPVQTLFGSRQDSVVAAVKCPVVIYKKFKRPSHGPGSERAEKDGCAEDPPKQESHGQKDEGPPAK